MKPPTRGSSGARKMVTTTKRGKKTTKIKQTGKKSGRKFTG